MNFTLSGSDECLHETSTKITTDTGGIGILLHWDPGQLKQFTNTNLTLQFMDANSNAPLGTDVKYNFTLLDKAGEVPLQKEDLVAKNATDSLSIALPADGSYPMQIFVKQLVTDSQNGPVEDSTRSGRALGYVVVPEFTLPVVSMVSAAFIGLVIFVLKYLTKPRSS